jgi:hypothetical protein
MTTPVNNFVVFMCLKSLYDVELLVPSASDIKVCYHLNSIFSTDSREMKKTLQYKLCIRNMKSQSNFIDNTRFCQRKLNSLQFISLISDLKLIASLYYTVLHVPSMG